MRATGLRCLLLLCALLVTSVPAARAERERTGPDSFLPYRAYTVEDLVAQVKSDSVVRQRLAKHFHVSQAELAGYLQKNLKVITFSSSGWKPVYGVTSTGRIYQARDYFREGGKVFGLADGTPVMKYACGNPLITELPRIAPKEVAAAPEVVVQTPEEYALVMDVPQAPQTEIPEAVTLEAPQEAAVAVAEQFEVSPSVASKKSLPLWPLVFIPFLDGDDDHPPVPEPGSLVLLGSGLAVIGGIIWRRRR